MKLKPAAAHTFFITGTDTGVGKTFAASALLRRARADGLRACGFKPVASGCERTPQGLRNEDALALQQAGGTQEPYELINPCAFEPAIAPLCCGMKYLYAGQFRRQIDALDL